MLANTNKTVLGSGQFGRTYLFGAGRNDPHVKVGTQAPIDAVSLGYVSAPPPLPLENIELISLINNNELNIGAGFNGVLSDLVAPVLPTDNVIITTEYKLDANGVRRPLWYKYTSRFPAKVTVGGTEVDTRVAYIEQAGGGPLPSGYYYTIKKGTEVSDGFYYLVVYTNFKGNFDTIFKLIYNASDLTLARQETLNASPAFRQIADIPNPDDQEVYYMEGTEGGYSLFVPDELDPDDVFVFVESGKQVWLDIPDIYSPDEAWYVRVHRGSLVDGSRRVRGYYEQPYENFVTILRARKEKATIINEQTLRTVHTPIMVDHAMPVDVYLNDYCITRTDGTDPIDEPDATYVPEAIVDIVGDRGVIQLDRVYFSAGDGDEVFVNYYYLEYYYYYRGWTDDSDQFIHLDVNPNAGHYYTDAASCLQHSTVGLLGKVIYLYWRPNGDIFHIIADQTDSSGGLNLLANPSKLFPFANDHFGTDVAASERTLLLGALYIRPELPKPILIDCRNSGGGLRPGQDTPAGSNAMFWDRSYMDGEPFCINGVSVLEASADQFDRAYINSVLEKFKAVGTVILIANNTGTVNANVNTLYEGST